MHPCLFDYVFAKYSLWEPAMKYLPKWIGALMVSGLILTMPSSAEEEFSMQGVLAVAKNAGACGILDSMIQFQTATKMAGGDEFVARFWNVESARRGMTVEQLSQQCNDSILAYGKLWDVAETP
jgi:hypothetical protein